MTGLLIFLILVLIGIAIWQLTKIFDLTQIGVNDNSAGVATDKDNKVNGYIMFAFLGFLYIFMIYGLFKWTPLVLGTPGSEHGQDYDNLMTISMVIIFIVQFITQFLLHFFAYKYKGKTQGGVALYYSDNNKLEMIWTGIPVIVLAGLILYGLYTWNNIMYFDEDEDVVFVEVYAKQFSWEARYAGKDNTLGKANVRFIEGVNTMGVDLADPAAQDDKVVSELHLPKGKKVVFKFRSQDIIHSAYMPHFRAQMNCVPGMVTEFNFVPTLTTEEMRNDDAMKIRVAGINEIRAEKSKELVAKGEEALSPYEFDYLLLCNKICGASHYNMQMKIVVEEQADFDKWLAEQQTLSAKWAEANKPAPAPQPEVIETAVDTTKVLAQVVE